MTIRIVTDSTCDLPADVVEKYQVVVVPAYVNIGLESLRDAVDLSRAQFYEELMGYEQHPTTAAPSAGEFAAVYEALTEAGASEIVSIHVSEKLSSIINSARNGAELGECVPVTAIDSEQLSMGLGFQVMAAAEAAEKGASAAEIVALLSALRPRVRTFAMLDTLDAVQRSGRVSWVQMRMGNLLRLKQIVDVWDGEVRPIARVRTRRKALSTFAQLVESLGDISQIAFMNTNNTAETMAEFQRLFVGFTAGVEVFETIACPAIGVHVGPQAIGVACVIS